MKKDYRKVKFNMKQRIKEFICRFLDLHREFVPGTHKGDIYTYGDMYKPGGLTTVTKFRCIKCDGLV
jgi:hypothetical protein